MTFLGLHRGCLTQSRKSQRWDIVTGSALKWRSMHWRLHWEPSVLTETESQAWCFLWDQILRNQPVVIVFSNLLFFIMYFITDKNTLLLLHNYIALFHAYRHYKTSTKIPIYCLPSFINCFCYLICFIIPCLSLFLSLHAHSSHIHFCFLNHSPIS